MKNLKILGVLTLLAAVALPVKQANAGIIVGIQGGYQRNNLYGTNSSTKVGSFDPVEVKTTRGDHGDNSDVHGGFAELNFDYTMGMGKMLYVGGGLYAQYAANKLVDWDKDLLGKQRVNKTILVGPEMIVGFSLIPQLDVSIRAGIGFNVTYFPLFRSKKTNNNKYSKPMMGVNWRILPGFTFKFGKVGLFLEAGYVGNWIQKKTEDPGLTTKFSRNYHGAQVGVGLKFFI